ncbi:hypothetical protein I907_gp34 [Bacillus phage Eoghan]|uniref:SsDNA binding protein n=2 Tax=Andromedavirus TaxID=1623275 RepID=M1I949_9CAUD|nr:hypothetical protein I907_gp34 [Bacillus phage Eoghan]YP_009592267.1 hypothetical protein FDG68_gp34 [Bacillus phage Taylor]AGE60798.1 hypothetical protein EOGHAN_34 [Bacillus phage Eoghan]AGE60952.1 hypothetical protein TAYLOR_34 [Bacillus phage Taylor]
MTNAWGNVNFEDDNNGGSRRDTPPFMDIKLGDNKLRILDAAPHTYSEWYAVKGNGGKGCGIPAFKEGDLLEQANRDFMAEKFKEADAKGLTEANGKKKQRSEFLKTEGYAKQPFGRRKDKAVIHVLDRSDGKVKLLDRTGGIFKQIQDLALNPEYGDPREYDITITKTDEKGKGNFQDIKYKVVAARSNTPLTDAEKAAYESAKVDLVELKTPNYTPEQALLIANGKTFSEVLGNGSETSQNVTAGSNPDYLPQDEKDSQVEPAPEVKEEKAPRQDEQADIGEELSHEEIDAMFDEE